MTMTFYAQPYDTSASGFFFTSADEFHRLAKGLRNAFGAPVEEFEIQFSDGEAIDAELAAALNPHQGDIGAFITAAADLDEHDKHKLIIAARECGEPVDLADVDPDSFDFDIYEGVSMRELAIQFADDGLFGDIPEHLSGYIDYDAIARDLAIDYAETEVAGVPLIYRAG